MLLLWCSCCRCLFIFFLYSLHFIWNLIHFSISLLTTKIPSIENQNSDMLIMPTLQIAPKKNFNLANHSTSNNYNSYISSKNQNINAHTPNEKIKNYTMKQKSKTIERFKIRKGEKQKAEPFFRSRLEDDPGTKSSEAYPSAAPA